MVTGENLQSSSPIILYCEKHSSRANNHIPIKSYLEACLVDIITTSSQHKNSKKHKYRSRSNLLTHLENQEICHYEEMARIYRRDNI